jgi:hypothetical protein
MSEKKPFTEAWRICAAKSKAMADARYESDEW